MKLSLYAATDNIFSNGQFDGPTFSNGQPVRAFSNGHSIAIRTFSNGQSIELNEIGKKIKAGLKV
jgi:hypothetical protein